MTAIQALRAALRRLTGMARRTAMERRLDEEMRFHVDMLAARIARRGIGGSEARRLALAAFGGAARVRADARDEYASPSIDELGQDARYAVRVLRRNPGFAIATVLTLALGIGAATAVFSLVHGVLLRPLAYADPERLVVLWERHVARAKDRNVIAVENFEAWRDRSRSFAAMAALVPAPVTVSQGGPPERMVGAEVSAGYFRLLGVRPALGRGFTEQEAGGADVVVLSGALWRSRFGADSAVIGRVLSLNGRPHTIVGVMPDDFDPPRFFWLQDQQFWVPFAGTPANRSWGRFLLVIARLRPGVEIDAARAEMIEVARQREREAASNVGWSTTVVGLTEQITGDVRSPLLVLLGAVALLLAMAVTNVATLVLSFTKRRAQELAVRRAIGATARRLVRQMLTLSALLGALGCALGVLVAFGAVDVLVHLLPADVPRLAYVRVDAPVLLFTAAVGIVATLGFGCAAALRAVRGAAGSALRAGTNRASFRLGGGSLVVGEVALGLVLTVLAALMTRSFLSLRAVDLGFDHDRIVVARVALTGDRFAAPERRRAFFDELVERTQTLPGVQSAALTSARPFGGEGPATQVTDASRPPVPGVELPVVDIRYVGATYFQTMRIPVLAGSTFEPGEPPDRPPRVVITQALARTIWGSEPPIGKRAKIVLSGGIVAEVIGVVGDAHLFDARTPVRPAAYLAETRFQGETRDLVVRGGEHPEAIIASVRAAVAALDPALPLYQVETMTGLVERSLARDRFTTVVLGAFAAVALVLAAVGIFGVFAGDVVQRRKEIGIRLALGASAPRVIALVMGRAMSRALVGIAVGTVAAFPLTRSMRSLLFGVTAGDPLSFAVVAAILLAVAAVATVVPALRAARVSPLIAIRTD